MSLWNWKGSGWVNSSLAVTLLIAVITSICSTGIRTGFKSLAPKLSFPGFYPEVGIFNIFLFCSVILGFVSVALRYSYIMDQVQVMPTAISYLNKISASTGIMSFFGLILIASYSASIFQKVSTFHSTGAYLFLGLGVIFTILQTMLTYTSSRFSVIFVIRLCLSLLLMCTFISSVVLVEKSSSFRNYTSLPFDNTSLTSIQYNQIENSFTQKEMTLLTACILEWICVIVYAFFFLSFFHEFQTISAYIIMRPFITSPSNDFRSSSLTVNERV